MSRVKLSRVKIIVVASSILLVMALLISTFTFTSSNAHAAYSCPPTLRYGSTGTHVSDLQWVLNQYYKVGEFPNTPYNFKTNGNLLAVDGIFGPKTRNAVKDYQNAHSLVVDGIVGPKTWHSLGYC
jgi:peptidoglycan hydrolase-like protein with peptidoglycan-binding domain